MKELTIFAKKLYHGRLCMPRSNFSEMLWKKGCSGISKENISGGVLFVEILKVVHKVVY